MITGSGSGYQGFYLAYFQNSCWNVMSKLLLKNVENKNSHWKNISNLLKIKIFPARELLNSWWKQIPSKHLLNIEQILLKPNWVFSHIVKTTFDESVMVYMRCVTRGLSRVSLSLDSKHYCARTRARESSLLQGRKAEIDKWKRKIWQKGVLNWKWEYDKSMIWWPDHSK